ncbi:MAG: HAD-superfamily hydrolase, subfamily variant 3 [Frankiales bacterium]|jgi:phosphoglycolate phosphatase|nr:HAD-superfamily hydrolase, subfamily variant 3 [Frankiales bacterium]
MTVPHALVCFDLPCLVRPAEGVAHEALDRALRRLGVGPGTSAHSAALRCGLRWPGVAAKEMFRLLFGSADRGEAGAAAFDDAFGVMIARRGAAVAPGAAAVVAACRQSGTAVCVTTEFSAATREAVLDVLDWAELVAMTVSPGNGHDGDAVPAVRTAAARALVPRGDRLAVVSGTRSGVRAGVAAGAGAVIGIPAEDDEAVLGAAGATLVCDLAGLTDRWSRQLVG